MGSIKVAYQLWLFGPKWGNKVVSEEYVSVHEWFSTSDGGDVVLLVVSRRITLLTWL